MYAEVFIKSWNNWNLKDLDQEASIADLMVYRSS